MYLASPKYSIKQLTDDTCLFRPFVVSGNYSITRPFMTDCLYIQYYSVVLSINNCDIN